MNKAQVIFKLVDIFAKPLQNTVHYDGITCIKDIKYGDLDVQSLDLYYETDKKDVPQPVLFYTHGGGFVMGGKKYRSSVSEIFVKMGFKVVNADYRLAPEYPFPASIEDSVAALNYIKNITEAALETDKVVVCGDSSGGYLAAYLVALYSSPELRNLLSVPEIEPKIVAMTGISGVYDVKKMLSMKFSFGIAKSTGESFLGMKLKRKMSNFDEHEFSDVVSVLDSVNPDWVPTMVLHSKKDLFCPGQGFSLLEKLRENNVKCEEHLATKFLDNHCYMLFYYRKAAKEAAKKTEEFLKNVIKESAENDG